MGNSPRREFSLRRISPTSRSPDFMGGLPRNSFRSLLLMRCGRSRRRPSKRSSTAGFIAPRSRARRPPTIRRWRPNARPSSLPSSRLKISSPICGIRAQQQRVQDEAVDLSPSGRCCVERISPWHRFIHDRSSGAGHSAVERADGAGYTPESASSPASISSGAGWWLGYPRFARL